MTHLTSKGDLGLAKIRATFVRIPPSRDAQVRRGSAAEERLNAPLARCELSSKESGPDPQRRYFLNG